MFWEDSVLECPVRVIRLCKQVQDDKNLVTPFRTLLMEASGLGPNRTDLDWFHPAVQQQSRLLQI